jgi:hypothetical protein
MRKMPAGQWVAFEGYDTIHDCKKPSKKTSTSDSERKPYHNLNSIKSSFENLDFPDIRIEQESVTPKSTTIPSTPATAEKQTQDLSSQYPPAKTSAFEIPPWVWWGLAIFVAYLFISSVISTPSSSPAERPTSMPISTAIPRPTSLSPPNIVATQSETCMPWKKVTPNLEGQLECVYGNVAQRKTLFSSDNSYSWFLVRFDIDPNTFYVTSELTLDINAGDCVMANSVILVDINDVPNMKVDELLPCSPKLSP